MKTILSYRIQNENRFCFFAFTLKIRFSLNRLKNKMSR